MNLPLKDWLYLGAIVLLIGLALWGRSHLIDEGEQKVLAADKAAVAKHDADVEAQAVRDAAHEKEATDGLKAKLLAIAVDSTQQPLAPVRLCFARGGDQGRAPGASPLVAGSEAIPDRTGDPGVPAGDRAGTDLEADVRTLGLAGQIDAAAFAELWDWSVKQAQR